MFLLSGRGGGDSLPTPLMVRPLKTLFSLRLYMEIETCMEIVKESVKDGIELSESITLQSQTNEIRIESSDDHVIQLSCPQQACTWNGKMLDFREHVTPIERKSHSVMKKCSKGNFFFRNILKYLISRRRPKS